MKNIQHHFKVLVIILFSINIYSQENTYSNINDDNLVKRYLEEIILIKNPKINKDSILKILGNKITDLEKWNLYLGKLSIRKKYQELEEILKIVDELYENNLIDGMTFIYTSLDLKQKYYFCPYIGVYNTQIETNNLIKEKTKGRISFWKLSETNNTRAYFFIDDSKYPILDPTTKKWLIKEFQTNQIDIYSIFWITLAGDSQTNKTESLKEEKKISPPKFSKKVIDELISSKKPIFSIEKIQTWASSEKDH